MVYESGSCISHITPSQEPFFKLPATKEDERELAAAGSFTGPFWRKQIVKANFFQKATLLQETAARYDFVSNVCKDLENVTMDAGMFNISCCLESKQFDMANQIWSNSFFQKG